MADFYNALDDEGVVHSLDKTPLYSTRKDGYSKVDKAGFTWCMVYFTWKHGPRVHSYPEHEELQLEQSLAHVTCLTCIAAESGVDLFA